MAEQEHKSRWYFLFRTDEGRIDVATWWRYTGFLVAIFAVLTVGWIFIAPYTRHNLATMPFFALSVIAANVYRIVYAFASLLLLVCYYNLSAKRFRDIGWPGAFAGILPFLAFLTWALHWLEPRVAGALPHYIVVMADIIVFATLIWTIFVLGGPIEALRRR